MSQVVVYYNHRVEEINRKKGKWKMILNEFIREIANAKTLEILNGITEKAAFDEDLTNDEYCAIYSAAIAKAQTI